MDQPGTGPQLHGDQHDSDQRHEPEQRQGRGRRDRCGQSPQDRGEAPPRVERGDGAAPQQRLDPHTLHGHGGVHGSQSEPQEHQSQQQQGQRGQCGGGPHEHQAGADQQPADPKNDGTVEPHRQVAGGDATDSCHDRNEHQQRREGAVTEAELLLDRGDPGDQRRKRETLAEEQGADRDPTAPDRRRVRPRSGHPSPGPVPRAQPLRSKLPVLMYSPLG